MPRHPVLFHMVAVPHARAVEAAAGRRMTWLEGAYPALFAWELDLRGPRPGSPEPAHAATVHATIQGGRTLHGKASAPEPLAAVRLAFNALERALEDEQAQARSRAAAWLGAVKRRLGEGLAFG